MVDSFSKVANTNRPDTDPTKKVDIIGKSPSSPDSDDSGIANARKRLYFNGSSYSGVDIKVLVHKYSTGPVQILADLSLAASTYSSIIPILDQIKDNIPKFANLSNDFLISSISQDTYNEKSAVLYMEPVRQIGDIEGTLNDTGYIQHIAGLLRRNFVDAKRFESSQGVINQIISIQDNLADLVLSWKSEHNAISELSANGKFFQTKVLAELQTLSIQTFREKRAVRAIGKTNPNGYVRGSRTQAGSMIFTVFDRNVLLDLLDYDSSDYDADNRFKAAILDQLPPIDITIQFANEYGSLSRMSIYGVEFVTEGQTMSVEDLILENVVQFVARDVDPMTPVLTDNGKSYSQALTAYNQALAQNRRPERPVTATDLVGSAWDNSKDHPDAAEKRFKNRNNPFF